MASPLKIKIGLHYWTTPTIYPGCEVGSVAFADAISDFVHGGLLKELDKPNQFGRLHEATDALGVWVEALCNVRWPVQVWVVPTDLPLSQGQR